MINQKLNSQNQTANRKTDKVGRIDLLVMRFLAEGELKCLKVEK
jgi:hypothetical protein